MEGYDREARQRRLPRLLAAIALAALLISLIPILAAAFYAHPLSDDFGFSAYVHQAVVNGGGILSVLKASLTKVSEVYQSWQGTFSAVFLFTLQPGAFSEDLYFLTTFLLIGLLCGGTYLLADTLTVCLFGARRSWGILLASAVLICSIQFVPDKAEAYYWYNGAVYYTAFYALSLVLFSLVLRMLKAGSRSRMLRCGVPACILAFFLGGGNYSTALVTLIVLVLTPPLVCVLRRAERSGRTAGISSCGRGFRVLYVLITILLLVSLAASAAAPGNAVRGEYTTGMSPVRAIVLSVYFALRYGADWTGTAQLALFAGAVPILYHLMRKVRFTFPYPMLVIAFVFLSWAAQFTPPLYAMSSVGSGRQINIYYYSYYLMVLICIAYLCGWAGRRGLLLINEERMAGPARLLMAGLLMTGLFVAGCASYGFSSLTSTDTALALLDGTAASYDAEYEEMITQIAGGEEYVSAPENVPDFFGDLLLSADADGWVNERMAQYYGVEYFYLAQDEP